LHVPISILVNQFDPAQFTIDRNVVHCNCRRSLLGAQIRDNPLRKLEGSHIRLTVKPYFRVHPKHYKHIWCL
jgi:hypothetical protein